MHIVGQQNNKHKGCNLEDLEVYARLLLSFLVLFNHYFYVSELLQPGVLCVQMTKGELPVNMEIRFHSIIVVDIIFNTISEDSAMRLLNFIQVYLEVGRFVQVLGFLTCRVSSGGVAALEAYLELCDFLVIFVKVSTHFVRAW